MAKVLDSFASLLDMTTQTFLLHENYHPNHEVLLRAVEEHQKSFTSLKKNLVEAKSEWRDYRMRAASRSLEGSEYELYDAAVEGLTRIAQHMNGLRDGTRLQFEMAAQGLRFKQPEAGEEGADINLNRDTSKESSGSASVFEELVEDVGPPLDALAVR